MGNFRSSVAQFLAALILMLFVAPFVDELKYGEAIDAVLMSLVLIAGVLAVGRSHRTLVLAGVLMLPAVGSAGSAIFGRICCRRRFTMLPRWSSSALSSFNCCISSFAPAG